MKLILNKYLKVNPGDGSEEDIYVYIWNWINIIIAIANLVNQGCCTK